MGLGRGALLWLLGIPLPIIILLIFLALKAWPMWRVHIGHAWHFAKRAVDILRTACLLMS